MTDGYFQFNLILSTVLCQSSKAASNNGMQNILFNYEGCGEISCLMKSIRKVSFRKLFLTGLDVQDFNVVPYDNGDRLFDVPHIQLWVIRHARQVGPARIEHIPDTKLEQGHS